MLYRYTTIILGIVIVAGCSAKGSAIAPVEDRTATSGASRAAQQPIAAQPDAVEISPYVASPVPTPVPAPITSPAPGPASPQPDKVSSAVNSLVSIANANMQGGQYDKAANSLERALRYDQKNATLWHRLAEVNLFQRDYAQAESKALKSNALADGDKSLMAQNWRLISKARRLQGNVTGADEAEVRAYQLSK